MHRGVWKYRQLSWRHSLLHEPYLCHSLSRESAIQVYWLQQQWFFDPLLRYPRGVWMRNVSFVVWHMEWDDQTARVRTSASRRLVVGTCMILTNEPSNLLGLYKFILYIYNSNVLGCGDTLEALLDGHTFLHSANDLSFQVIFNHFA